MTEGRISTKAAIALLGAYCGSKRNKHCIALIFVKAMELRETVLLCLERISNKKCFYSYYNYYTIITTTTWNPPPQQKKKKKKMSFLGPVCNVQAVICSVRSFPLAGFDMLYQSNTCKLCVIVTEAFVKQTFG